MAQFDESKIISPLHTEKAEVGKKYWFSDYLSFLKRVVEENDTDKSAKLVKVEENSCTFPFYLDGEYSWCPWQFLYPYEESPKQRMTNRQFCEWCNKGNGQWKWKDSSQCLTAYSYYETNDNKEVDEDIHIRSWGSDEWVEPTTNIYERDCKKEN